MIRIGIVGVGFMGRIHYLAASSLKGAKLAAVCSRDQAKLAGDWRGHPRQLRPARRAGRSVRASRSTSGSTTCSPTRTSTSSTSAIRPHLHPRHGHRRPEGRQARPRREGHRPDARATPTRWSRPRRRPASCSWSPTCCRSSRSSRFAAEAIRDGRYGKLLGGHFKRVISRPDWSADIGDAAKTGGPAVDLHIHDTHFIGLVCGVPKRVVLHRRVVENGVGRVPDDAVPLRPRRPGRDLLERGRGHERPAVRPRLRAVPGEGDARLRVAAPAR